MTDVTTCAACGAQYLRVQRPVCVDCGAPLAVGALLAPGEDEVGYELDDWDDAMRDELSAALVDAGIPHRWEETELVVAEPTADRTEALIDEVESEELEEDDDDTPGGAELLAAFYVASDVLQHEAANPAAVTDLLEAAEAMPDAPPYGVDVDLWAGIRERVDVLADLLGDEADDLAVTAAARELREAVRDLV